MESIQDMLAPEKNNIPIHEDPKIGQVSLPGAGVVKVRDADQFLQLLQTGEANRHAANTNEGLVCLLIASKFYCHAIVGTFSKKNVVPVAAPVLNTRKVFVHEDCPKLSGYDAVNDTFLNHKGYDSYSYTIEQLREENRELKERKDKEKTSIADTLLVDLAKSLPGSLSNKALELVQALEGKSVETFLTALRAMTEESGILLKKLVSYALIFLNILLCSHRKNFW